MVAGCPAGIMRWAAGMLTPGQLQNQRECPSNLHRPPAAQAAAYLAWPDIKYRVFLTPFATVVYPIHCIFAEVDGAFEDFC